MHELSANAILTAFPAILSALSHLHRKMAQYPIEFFLYLLNFQNKNLELLMQNSSLSWKFGQ